MDVRRGIAASLALAGAGTVALTGCGAATTNAPAEDAAATSPVTGTVATAVPTAPVLATAGPLQISAGYVPQPASPDVAAAYLTITDTGDQPDALVAARSDASATTTLHRTQGGVMLPLAELPVPAHGSAAFTPGADHLMLEHPTRPLTKGGRVVITLTFRVAGEVTVTLPVTGYPVDGGVPSEALTPLPSGSASS